MLRAILLALPLVAASAVPALAHGGGLSAPAGNGGPGPATGPREEGPTTKWETWWADNREDLLRIGERADAGGGLVATPGGVAPDAPDPVVRRKRLSLRVRETLSPVLRGALADDSDYDVRAAAAIALGKTGDPAAAKPLRDMAKNDLRPEARRAALLGLGVLGRGENLVFLCDLAADRARDADERGTALLAAGVLGGDDAAEWLTYFVEKSFAGGKRAEDAQVLGAAYVALGATGSASAAETLARTADDPERDSFFRGHAVLSLGRLRDHRSVGRLVMMLKSDDVTLRRCAAAAIGRVATGLDAPAAEAMVQCLASERDVVARRFLLESMGAVRCAATKRALLACLQDGPASERRYAALGLGVLGDPAAAPLIRKAFADERDDDGKSAFLLSMGLLRDRDAVPLLEDQVSAAGPSGARRGYAALSLAVVPSPGSRDVLWRRLCVESDARVRGDCAVALGLLGDGRVRDRLIEELKGPGPAFQRATAATCLGALRRLDAMSNLMAIARDPLEEGVVRAFCVVAQGQIADESLVPKLSRLAGGGDASLATRALAEALTIL